MARKWIIQFNWTPTKHIPFIDSNVDPETEEDYAEFGATANKIYEATPKGKLVELNIPELREMAERAAAMPRTNRDEKLAYYEAWKQVEFAADRICRNWTWAE
jgi:hypothetical protein